MSTQPRFGHWAGGLALSLAAAVVLGGAQPSASAADRLARLRERFPAADANGDGILTPQEAGAFRTQRQAAVRAGGGRATNRERRIAPSHADIAYGPDERQVLDLYLAPAGRPTPLVIHIHGGGFVGGNKESVGDDLVGALHAEGISVASIHYRFITTDPFPAPFLDGARAVQFLRLHAGEYGLDPQRFAVTGGSAGAGISLWLAMHDDLAIPGDADPLRRQSTRVSCALVYGAQVSYDPRFWREHGMSAGLEHPSFGRMYPRTEGEADESPRRLAIMEECAPIHHATADDPPVLLVYGQADTPITADTPGGETIHHPRHGRILERTLEPLGVSCAVVAPGEERSGPGPVAFLVHGLRSAQAVAAPAARWFRGNTHTHTLWSDGDGPPEMVADWYVRHGYDFLVLSDHNVLSQGDRWFPVRPKSRLTAERVERLRETYGGEWVAIRERDGQSEMRLKTLPELREHFERPGAFLFIQGEELTDQFEQAPVHLNGVNLAERIPPQGGDSLRAVLQRNIDAVIAQGRRLNRPVLAHINHPNFGWAMTAEDIASVTGERFFEVYNGHSGVRNYGDATHPSTERMWDVALQLRLTRLDLGLLLGLATDDSHEYYEWGVGITNPGRGWVMVRAARLTAEAIVNALRAGDFYASSGVSVEDFHSDGKRYEVRVRAEPGLTYTTEFIGTRKGATHPADIGLVLAATSANPAVYTFKGDELYVRARVTSSRLHPNPYAAGDHETAWLQPVRPR